MAINPNISLAVRGIELQDPLAQYGKVMAIQGAQQQNQLAQYQLGAAQRAEATQNVLADAYSQSIDPDTGKINYNKLTGLLAKGGGGSQIPGIEKTRREIETAALTTKKTEGEIAKNEFNLQQDRFTKAWQSAGAAATPQIAIDQLTKAVRSGEIDMATAAREIQNLQNMPPEQYRDWRANKILSLMDAKDQYAATVPKVMSQFEAARLPIYQQQADTAQSQLGVSQGQLGVAQRREEKDDPRKVVAFRETDAAGNVTLLNKFGEIIQPAAPVKGKPSATFEKTTAQRKQLNLDLDRAITELTDATKPGGLIDQSTGSGIGQLRDVGAGFFGKATSGAIAGSELAPIADMVLKMVPRFEGPQSNKDTTSYEKAAGQLGNTTLPSETRKQAGLQILRLMKDRKGQFVTPEMAAEGAAPGTAPAAAPNIDALLDKYK